MAALADWHEFSVAMLGAAAALAGLVMLFVSWVVLVEVLR